MAAPAWVAPDKADLARHAAVMEGLSGQLQALAALIPRGTPVAYVDYPVHQNIGDLLINLGTEAWLERNGVVVGHRSAVHTYNPRALRRAVPEGAILCHGGGNFGDLYPAHTAVRERVLADFPDRAVIFLPQTIHFRDPAAEAESAKRAREHGRLTIFVRDVDSLAVARRFSDQVMLMPDMAHALWPLAAPAGAPDRPHLRLIRRDIEARSAATAADDVDWTDLVPPGSLTALNRLLRWFDIAQRNPWLPQAVPLWRRWYRLRDRLVQGAVAGFAHGATIHTDRLHGVLMAALLARPVSYGDNTYGKVSRYVATFLDDTPLVRRAEG